MRAPSLIPLLEPLFQGEWRPYGETLQCGPCLPWSPDTLPVASLIVDHALLMDLLHRHAAHLGTDDLRPVASAWSMHYLWTLLPPVMAAATVLRHAFPVLPQDMAVTFDAHGEPTQFHISHIGSPRPRTDTHDRYRPLIEMHLRPLFEALHLATRVPMKILWGNASRYVDSILEHALALTDHAPGVAEDHFQLLTCARWPDGGINPLHGLRREVRESGDGQHTTLRLHRQCCLYYLLPGEGYCGACPLAPQFQPRRHSQAL